MMSLNILLVQRLGVIGIFVILIYSLYKKTAKALFLTRVFVRISGDNPYLTRV
jgi:hypothetical protein